MMRYNKYMWILIAIVVGSLFSACEKTGKCPKNSDKMPDIVFMCISDLSEIASEGEPLTSVTFIDKNGNQYITDDHYVDNKSCCDLCRIFSKGKLDEFIKLRTTCDTKELSEQYKVLNKIVENKDFKVDESVEYDLEIEAMRTTWVGLYYNEKNEVSALVLQKEDGNGIHYANDEDAVKLCDWYKNVSAQPSTTMNE